MSYTDSEMSSSVDQDETKDEQDLVGQEIDEAELLRRKEIASGAMRSELKYLDHRWSQKGQRYYVDTKDEAPPEQTNWWKKYAMCLVRDLDRKNKKSMCVSLQINSEHITTVLKDVVDEYPGISLNTKQITIDEPYHVLFHYREALQSRRSGLEEGSTARQHLDLLLDFIQEQFRDAIVDSENLLDQKFITFELLWTIFRPKTTIYAAANRYDLALEVADYRYGKDMCGEYLEIEGDYIDFDGEDFGWRTTELQIRRFPGAKSINALRVFPLAFHPAESAVRERLIARGQRFQSYAGTHFATYKGVTIQTSYNETRGRNEEKLLSIDGRVVVDCSTWHRLNADFQFSVRPLPRGIHPDHADGSCDIEVVDPEKENSFWLSQTMTPEHHLLCTPKVRGFSFTEKAFLDLFIDNLAPVEWNTECFSSLVLPAAQKSLVRALVTEHVERSTSSDGSFDDIISGKGLGLILLLHGPPGVGKTLTAECVSEYVKRPLYIVSAGDLGTDPATLEQKLGRILDMASTWNVVLLIDEADIFLERRTLHDMTRNALVGIFLRVLEYYQGILFLTSNRVETFDDAFKSRIHVPLKYPDLPLSSRVSIWRSFLAKANGVETAVSESEIEALARRELNGRQIKNVIRTAKSLAQFEGKKIDAKTLETVVGIQMAFERQLDTTNEKGWEDLTGNGVVDGDAEGEDMLARTRGLKVNGAV